MSKALVTPIGGVDVDAVDDDPKFPLGTEVIGSDGNTYRYVQADAELSTTEDEPIALAIDEDEQANKLSGALALAGHRIGFLPKKIVADTKYFWARMRGVFDIRVAASTSADVTLGLAGGTDGRLTSSVPTTASAGNAVVLGVTITAAASASTSAGNSIRTAIVTYPLAKSPGV